LFSGVIVKIDLGIGMLFTLGKARNRGEIAIKRAKIIIIPFLYFSLIKNLFSHRERFFSLICFIKRENKMVMKPRRPVYMLNLPAVSERYIATERKTIESVIGKYELIEIRRIMSRIVKRTKREKLVKEFTGIKYRINKKQGIKISVESKDSFFLSATNKRKSGRMDTM